MNNRLWPVRPAETDQWAILDEMARYRNVSSTVVVGTPVFIAHLDLRTPPELAVMSNKRFSAGQLDAPTIALVIERERPEQVLITRDFPSEVREHLRHEIYEDYLRIAWRPEVELELFVRRALFDYPVPASKIMLQSDEWFRSEGGVRSIDRLISWQNPHGGWAKGYNAAHLYKEGMPFGEWNGVATFDNNHTCTEIRIIARAFRITRRLKVQQAINSALDFVINAAYPNGGWPQRWPPPEDYGASITFNDDVMLNILKLLRDVVDSEDFAFVDTVRRGQARAAFERGLACLLRCQIPVRGVLSGWAQQYDPNILTPISGRSYEPPAIAGRETANIVSFLMDIDAPSPGVCEAVHAAVAWFEKSTITGRKLRVTPEDVVLVEESSAQPLWARFYDITTNRPIYCGRDGVIRFTLADIELERRRGYEWLGPWGTEVLRKYQWWLKRQSERENN